MYWRWPWKLVPSLILAWDKIIERLRWIVINILRWAPRLCWGRDFNGCPLLEAALLALLQQDLPFVCQSLTYISVCAVLIGKGQKAKTQQDKTTIIRQSKRSAVPGWLLLQGDVSTGISEPTFWASHWSLSEIWWKKETLQFTCKTWKLLGAWCFKIWSMAKGRVHNGEATPICECSPKSQSVSGPWSAPLIASLHISPRCCILLYWQ